MRDGGGADLDACAECVASAECAESEERTDFAVLFFRFLRVDFVVLAAVVTQGSWA